MIDFSTVITDFDGNDMSDGIAMQSNGGQTVALTLGRAASHALCATFQDEREIAGDEKFRRGLLAAKVYAGGEHALSAEEVTLIKKLLAKAYAPSVIVRAWPMLDPALVLK